MIVSIGQVSKTVKAPQKPEYVPRKYCKLNKYFPYITYFVPEGKHYNSDFYANSVKSVYSK